MRILDVNSSYSPSGGGIRVYHQRKLDYFASSRSRHSSALAVPGTEDRLDTSGPGRVYHLKSIPLMNSGYRMLVDSGGINSVLLDYRPDIVEVGSPYLLPHLVRSAMGALEVPLVGFYHTDFPDSYVAPYAGMLFPRPIASLFLGAARRHASKVYGSMTAVFAASGCMLAKLRDLGVRRLFRTPLGVDAELFSPSARSEDFRRSMGVPEGGALVLYLARLHWEKGLDILMESYPLFRDPGRIRLVIGGRGPHSRLVDEFISRYPEVRRLAFMKDRQAVATAMASSDVFLALGRYETFGLAGLEAISCGTIPVFPDMGASAEMAASLDLLPAFSSKSPAGLAESVLEAIDASRQDHAAHLREFAGAYTWESVFRRMEGYYEMILDAFHEGHLDRLVPPGDWWE